MSKTDKEKELLREELENLNKALDNLSCSSIKYHLVSQAISEIEKDLEKLIKEGKKMILNKTLVDEVIRLTKKYHESNDIDYLPTLLEAKKVLEENATWQVGDLLYDLAQYTQVSGKGTYDDIYKALAIFGIIVEDKDRK